MNSRDDKSSWWKCTVWQMQKGTYIHTYEGESNENLKYFLSRNCSTSWMIWCADPWLISRCAVISFTITQRFTCMMASTAAMASGVTTQYTWPDRGKSVTEAMPFMNFLVHSYTCCSDRYASPYWTFIYRWISMGFIPSLLKNQMTEHSSSLAHVASGATIFTLLLGHHVAFLHLTATCRPLFKPWVPLLSTHKTIKLCFEF